MFALDAAKDFDGWEDETIAGELGVAPEDVQGEEAEEEDGCPDDDAVAPGGRGADDEERFQIADLGSGENPEAGEDSDVGDAGVAREVQDAAGGQLPRGGVRNFI